ncbi:MAG: T9SS type A sorting domain-containing protein [Flavobacteriales bacterium]|nr:T9SS type A sorting domain-containing protein [Flavobacteriales bacterium]
MRLAILAFLFSPLFIFGQDLSFSDITAAAGTDIGGNNNGVVMGDIDNDGFEDMFIPGRLSPNKLYKNMGDGTFENVINDAGIQTEGLTMTAVFGDIDNDGDLDLFIGNYYISASAYPNYLYLNDGTGHFEDISLSAGILTPDQTRSVHMCDVDLDGYTDIYVCNLSQENILWHNNGDNTFTDHTVASGLTDTMISMGAMFFDYDNDGDQDIYLTHDANQPYIMYENDGTGVFTDVSEESNLNFAGMGMGVDHGDINNDGHLDIYVTNLGPNSLFLNDGNGVFTDIAGAAGVDDGGMSWGCFFIDYDNDGWEDIYMINDSNFSPLSNKLYKNNGDNTFTLVSENSPLYSFYGGFGGTWADIDENGYQDILVANNEDGVGVQIFENNYSDNHWIAFELEGVTDAKDAFGTRVQITCSLGNKIDEKTAGSSYSSQNSHRVHFGLGSDPAISDIFVIWPDGTVDYYESLEADQIHTLIQGANPSTSIEELRGHTITVYPNPFVSELNVSANTPAITHFEIFDMNGEKVYSDKINSYGQLINVRNDLAAGNYILRLMNGENVVNAEKIIKN